MVEHQLVIVVFNSCNIRDEVYRGEVGVGGGWEAEGGQHHPQGGKQQCCVLSRAQKLHSQPGRTRQSSAAV